MTSPRADKPTWFGAIRTGQDVAAFLGISWHALRFRLYRASKDQLYRSFAIRKRHGGIRHIKAPSPELKHIQHRLLDRLTETYEPAACVHGYVFGRNILSNASRHVGSRVLLNVDLKDFFPSIHIGRVIGLFLAWPFRFGREAAVVIAQICTHDGHLPQGAPTSPLISNMICYKLDRELTKLATVTRCNYTRYADDLTFSTRYKALPGQIVQITADGVRVGSSVAAIISTANFQINAEKVRLQNRSQRMVVTGLKVNRFPNVSRRLLSQVRAMLHAWKKFGITLAQAEFEAKYNTKTRSQFAGVPAFRNVLLGRLLFIGQIRGFSDSKFTALAAELYDRDPTLLPKAPSYAVKQKARGATCVLTDDDESRTGTGFFVTDVGLVTCNHVAEWATKAFYPDALSEQHAIRMIHGKTASDLAICETPLRPRYMLTPNYGDVPNDMGVFLHGFPQYNPGFLGQFQSGQINGRRNIFGYTRYIVSMRIVAGNSGGPLLNSRGEVIGVAVTGDVDQPMGYSPSDYGVIPIRFITELFSGPS